uniref:ATP synthase CFO B chain subunit I n=1 Tax=Rhodymenia pseudopalmata TaxID=31502 RepID=A0A1C9C7H0_RHOPU|nr:ATP synthase CFO B chain subunit I [Rhodymenia pseudopalmata]AOM64322.1 ATP synthase CFO B chain subunit I [Rhodymenia pseudopalmata]
MQHTMQLLQIFTAYSDSQAIGFNSDFLEANVINIAMLLSGLIYILRQFLGSILFDRQEKVLFAIQEAEERLHQADIRLNESEKQLSQTQMVINQIIKEAEITAQKVRQSILDQGKVDIERLTLASKVSIETAEIQIRQQIQQQIIALAINRVTLQLQNQVTATMQAKIIDSSILGLGG